jgi:hypothetical protein
MRLIAVDQVAGGQLNTTRRGARKVDRLRHDLALAHAACTGCLLDSALISSAPQPRALALAGGTMLATTRLFAGLIRIKGGSAGFYLPARAHTGLHQPRHSTNS